MSLAWLSDAERPVDGVVDRLLQEKSTGASEIKPDGFASYATQPPPGC